MAFNPGKLFSKQSINEPFLHLDDPRWAELEGGYRTLYDASVPLKKLEQSNDQALQDDIYKEFWNELHHQGHVGLASYYAVPHLMRIAKIKRLTNWNILGLVSVIEIQRHKNNPKLPSALIPIYNKALVELGEFAILSLNETFDLETINVTLAAIAVSKSQIKLANAIMNLDSEDVINEFLENY